MFEAIGHAVEALSREAFAGITLEGLACGKRRYLGPAEVKSLQRQTGLSETGGRGLICGLCEEPALLTGGCTAPWTTCKEESDACYAETT
jgi:hypothetical protein